MPFNSFLRRPDWLRKALRTQDGATDLEVPSKLATDFVLPVVDSFQSGWGVLPDAEQWQSAQYILSAAVAGHSPLIGSGAPIDFTNSGANDVTVIVWGIDVEAAAALTIDFYHGRQADADAAHMRLKRLTFGAAARMPAQGIVTETAAAIGAAGGLAMVPFCILPSPAWTLFVEGGSGGADMTFTVFVQVVPRGFKPL